MIQSLMAMLLRPRLPRRSGERDAEVGPFGKVGAVDENGMVGAVHAILRGAAVGTKPSWNSTLASPVVRGRPCWSFGSRVLDSVTDAASAVSRAANNKVSWYKAKREVRSTLPPAAHPPRAGVVIAFMPCGARGRDPGRGNLHNVPVTGPRQAGGDGILRHAAEREPRRSPLRTLQDVTAVVDACLTQSQTRSCKGSDEVARLRHHPAPKASGAGGTPRIPSKSQHSCDRIEQQ
eukprot:gene9455-biopygen4199